MFVSTAFAQADGAGGGPGGLEAFLPIILIFVVFYFLLIRPQQKKMKQHKEMLNAVRRGDRVVTGGGIVGTVTKVVDDNDVMVEIADGIRVRVQRALISQVVAKTEPVKETTGSGKGSGGGESGDEQGQSGQQAKGGGSLLKKLLGGKAD